MMKQIKKIPKFKNEDEERAFWVSHDTTDYFDTAKAVKLRLTNLKPSNESISLRLPTWMLEAIKQEAHKRDIPYQSYLKSILYELFIESCPRV